MQRVNLRLDHHSCDELIVSKFRRKDKIIVRGVFFFSVKFQFELAIFTKIIYHLKVNHALCSKLTRCFYL